MNTASTAWDQAREEARDQILAAWQLQIARLEEQIRSGWQSHIDLVLQERFRDLSAAVAAEAERAFEARLAGAVESARKEERQATARRLTGDLNQAVRRLRLAEKQHEWCSSLLDAAAPFASRVAVLSVQGTSLRLERCSESVPAAEIPLASAPAIAQALETQEPLVASFHPREISDELAGALGTGHGPRVYLFPVLSSARGVGLLLAEGAAERVETDALELLATIAGSVWEVRAQSAPAPNGLVNLPTQVTVVATPQAPAWSELPAPEQDLHLRAQRFARVQVAEIRLFQSSVVKQGRAGRSLYRMLRDQIDPRREEYRRHFLKNCPSMVDYFHLELVRTLANDNEELLGSDYPGALV